MRTIPAKNYGITILIVIASFLALWYVVSIYQARHEYELDQNKRMNLLSELKESELQNYILDNHDVILYFSSSREETYKKFEQGILEYLKETGLTSAVVYVDTSQLSHKFYTTFEKNYVPESFKGQVFQMIPNFVVLTGGQVSNVLYRTQVEPNISDVKTFLEGEQ